MTTTPTTQSLLVLFGRSVPKDRIVRLGITAVIAPLSMRTDIEALNLSFRALEEIVSPESVYEADALLQELVRVPFRDKVTVPQSYTYKGYELWWIHYGELFYHFCLPYTRYRALLEYARGFARVYLWQAPQQTLFSYYFKAHGVDVSVLRGVSAALPFGVLLKIILTLLFLPVLAVRRKALMIFTSDKFERDRPNDFRQRLVYEELERRRIPFVECIRGLESWRTVLDHAIKRGRAVFYSDTAIFVGRFFALFSKKQVLQLQNIEQKNTHERFVFFLATHFVRYMADDVWAIRLTRILLRIIGVKVAYITAGTERNFHTVIACKLEGIPTVGIMHGVASRYGTPADFMPGFSSKKKISVDRYGVWSAWWKVFYDRESDAYAPEQLRVSGPMRPHSPERQTQSIRGTEEPRRVLFIAEQTAVPSEVMPYLSALVDSPTLKLTIKFRPTRDGFEEWLRKHEPHILKNPNITSLRGSMGEAIADADVVIGCHSTAVLEALLHLKAPLFIQTRKWGDYYRMSQGEETKRFFVQTPEELLTKIDQSATVPQALLEKLREQYFGDPHANGSRWVVEEVSKLLRDPLRGVDASGMVSEHETRKR